MGSSPAPRRPASPVDFALTASQDWCTGQGTVSVPQTAATPALVSTQSSAAPKNLVSIRTRYWSIIKNSEKKIAITYLIILLAINTKHCKCDKIYKVSFYEDKFCISTELIMLSKVKKKKEKKKS